MEGLWTLTRVIIKLLEIGLDNSVGYQSECINNSLWFEVGQETLRLRQQKSGKSKVEVM